MELRQVSYRWSLLVGFMAVIAQMLMFFLRFGNLAPQEAKIFDYLFFFLAGIAGGLVLVFFLNRSRSAFTRWFVGLFFLAGAFPSMVAMVGGGLFGPLGTILFPTFNWILITGIGYLVGRFFSRGRTV